jgi:phosphoribosylanthranilate isomerase
MRVRVKICGITRLEDALAAVQYGADAIGFVFDSGSPRFIDGEKAADIAGALPPFVTKTGLFVDADAGFVHRMLEQVPLDLLQFHGEEESGYCGRFRRPYIKSVAMDADVDLAAVATVYSDASALLLDASVPGIPGGTGERFDWSLVPADASAPIILAGGLTPENVGEAIASVRPYAVDVSSGVEREKGIKDAARIEAFMQEVGRLS